MEKLTLVKLIAKDKKKDGTPYTWPSGDTYTMLFVQTREHGDMWFSCAGQAWNKHWKVGDTIEVDVEHSADGKWHNLKKPDPIHTLRLDIMALTARVMKLEIAFKEQNKHRVSFDARDEIDPSALTF